MTTVQHTNEISHRPPHLYLDREWYFITAHTIGEMPLFISNEQKSIWFDEFISLTKKYDIDIAAWVLLSDHYHILCFFEKSVYISDFIKRLHGVTSYQLNKFDKKPGRKVWYSYWDRCVRDEGDYWTKFNYIHYNPIKHSYVNDLTNGKFSSYMELLKTKGKDWLGDCWKSYPVVTFDFES